MGTVNALSLLICLSAVVGAFEDFDPWRTAGEDPIAEKEELYRRDIPSLKEIRRSKANTCPKTFDCPPRFMVSKVPKNKVKDLCPEDMKPVMQCKGIELGCDCVIWTCAARNCSEIQAMAKFEKETACEDKCQSRQLALYCGCSVYTCQNSLCTTEKPKCDAECEEAVAEGVDDCHCAKWKCAPKPVAPPPDRKVCDPKTPKCPKCHDCRTYRPYGKRCARMHPEMEEHICERKVCNQKCGPCEVAVPSTDGCCVKCFPATMPKPKPECSKEPAECHDRVEVLAHPELPGCEMKTWDCPEKKCPVPPAVHCTACEYVETVQRGPCHCPKLVCLQKKCPTASKVTCNKCQKKVTTKDACGCEIEKCVKDCKCGPLCNSTSIVTLDGCGCPLVQCQEGAVPKCVSGTDRDSTCTKCEEKPVDEKCKPSICPPCFVREVTGVDALNCTTYRCREKIPEDVKCGKCADAVKTGKKDTAGCPIFECRPRTCDCKPNQKCVTKAGCPTCVHVCDVVPLNKTPRCKPCEYVSDAKEMRQGVQCPTKRCRKQDCPKPKRPEHCNTICKEWKPERSIRKGNCCPKWICVPKHQKCPKCKSDCEQCVKEMNVECGQLEHQCKPLCKETDENGVPLAAPCYMKKKDEKTRAVEVDKCDCPIWEPVPPTPFVPEICDKKGELLVFGRDKCYNPTTVCIRCPNPPAYPNCTKCQELGDSYLDAHGCKRRDCVPKKCPSKEEMSPCKRPCEREIVKTDECGCCHVQCESECPEMRQCKKGFTAVVVKDTCGCNVLSDCVRRPRPRPRPTPAASATTPLPPLHSTALLPSTPDLPEEWPEETPKNYTDAVDDCVKKGGTLVTILSPKKNEDVKEMIEKDSWIGLDDRKIEGVFVWISGIESPFTNFPTEAATDEDMDCVAMSKADGKWRETPCDEKKPYVCIRLPSKAPTTSPTQPTTLASTEKPTSAPTGPPSIVVEPVCEKEMVCTKYVDVSSKKCQECGKP